MMSASSRMELKLEQCGTDGSKASIVQEGNALLIKALSAVPIRPMPMMPMVALESWRPVTRVHLLFMMLLWVTIVPLSRAIMFARVSSATAFSRPL